MAGYQAAGTRGRRLLDGEPTVRVHGTDVPVRAECIALHGLSGHGDRSELIRWLRSGERAPRSTYLTHGEPQAAMTFAAQIRRELGWRAMVPQMGDEYDLLD